MAEPPGPDRAPPDAAHLGHYGLAGRAEWWETWAADDPSPTSLASAESRLRLHVRPWFADRPIDKITPADVRRWQAHLDRDVGPATLAQCRSTLLGPACALVGWPASARCRWPRWWSRPSAVSFPRQ